MITKTDINNQADLTLTEDGMFELHVSETQEVSYTIIGIFEVCERNGVVDLDYIDVANVEDSCNQSLNWLKTLIDKKALKQTLLGFEEIQSLIEEESKRLGVSCKESKEVTVKQSTVNFYELHGKL